MTGPRWVDLEAHTVHLSPKRDENYKYCPRCDDDLPITEFHKNSSKADGLSSYCKEHAKKATNESRKRHPKHRGES